jgi:hypothetical protein
MRAAFETGVDGFLSVDGLPTIAFAAQEDIGRSAIDRIHRVLWNQGLASILVVIAAAEIRVYSLWQRPISPGAVLPEDGDRRLIEVLDLVDQTIRAKELVRSVESGHYFDQNKDKFRHDTRIDATLLSNLRVTQAQLKDQGMPVDAAKSLILQIIFIAYLEDRQVIDSAYFYSALSDPAIDSLSAVLARRDPQLLAVLFSRLSHDLNGDVFHSLGAFGAWSPSPEVKARHLGSLAEFRQGVRDLESGQGRFWPYDFAFIPVELISAIYDRFLNEDDGSRRDLGAYFTPRFLADLVVDQAWSTLADNLRARQEVRVLDPACGSSIFLVLMFQKMVNEWSRTHCGASPDWPTLLTLLERLHGWDTQESAISIGAFSLYVALLEQVHPPAIQALMAQGKALPLLLGRTLCRRDFFSDLEQEPGNFDLIIGNPPWISRNRAATSAALAWCDRQKRPAPGGEIAWAFIWKSTEHLSEVGKVALLLPAMGILLNHSPAAISAREQWLEEARVIRIINFADICFQLFDGADRPTILAVYGSLRGPSRDYELDYWVPKAHRLTSRTRSVTISSMDRSRLRRSQVCADPLLWKKRMWATPRDLRLLGWLGDLPKLSRFMITHRDARSGTAAGWVIGQGFKPDHSHGQRDFTTELVITELPFLDVKLFQPWVIPTIKTKPWPTATVHRRGFVNGFSGPHILVPQGMRRGEALIRAAYVDQSLCFRHAVQAIRFPSEEAPRAKLLTAVLNSRLAAWYYFHASANLGADRAKVHEEQLLDLPFPEPDDLPESYVAREAQNKIVGIVDDLLARRDEVLLGDNWLQESAERANELVFEFYGLDSEERAIINDGVQYVIPSMQPRRDRGTPLTADSHASARRAYVKTLVETLNRWTHPAVYINCRLLESAAGPSVLELQVSTSVAPNEVVRQSRALEASLGRALKQLPAGSSHNIELQPDLKVFYDDMLYIVKPASARYWLRTTALNDADEIIGDLFSERPDSVAEQGRK